MTKRAERIKEITRTRKKQILEAAFNVFCRKGYGLAKATDIAEEASVSVGTIYKYFKDKHALFIAVINEYILSEKLKSILTDAMGADTHIPLKGVIIERLGHKQEDLMKYFFIISEVIRNPSLRKKYRDDILSPMLGMMEQYTSQRIESGMFRNVDERVATRVIGGMIIGLLILYAAEGKKSPLEEMPKEKIAEDVFTIVFKGLLKEEEVPDGETG